MKKEVDNILVVDIEANGLYDTVTKIHCIVVKEKGTKNVWTYFDNSDSSISYPKRTGKIEEGLRKLEKASMIIGHNFIDYDYRVIKKLYPDFKYSINKIRDTLIRSYLSNPHRERHFKCPPTKLTVEGRKMIGPHSLENFGYIVGRGKVGHEDWTKFTKEMLHRCIEDVEITDLVDDFLVEEMGKWDWSVAEEIEKDFRFILSEQESYGWLVDRVQLERCLKELASSIAPLDAEILPQIPPMVIRSTKATTAFTAKGRPTALALRYLNDDEDSVAGDFSRVGFEQINLNSNDQVKEYLLNQGWKPQNWNYKKKGKQFIRDERGQRIKTSPKLKDDSGELDPFEGVEDGVPKLIVKRIQLRHRESQIQGWRNKLRSDGRIGAGGNSCGTNTGRVTHRTVVNVPKAEDGVFFGKEMRSIFSVKEGYKLVGGDLSALENRIAAHFTYKYDNGEYGERILQSDPHQYLADKWKMKGKEGRSLAKKTNYAIMYGANWPKIQSILGCTKNEAMNKYNDWWEVNPALKKLKNALERCLENRGECLQEPLSKNAYIKGIDGRKIFLRSWHSVMNSLFQNAGSMVAKVAAIEIYAEMKRQGIRGHIVGQFHDEVQAEICEKDIDKYKKIVLESFKNAGKYFNLNIPIEGECKVGRNWAETH